MNYNITNIIVNNIHFYINEFFIALKYKSENINNFITKLEKKNINFTIYINVLKSLIYINNREKNKNVIMYVDYLKNKLNEAILFIWLLYLYYLYKSNNYIDNYIINILLINKYELTNNNVSQYLNGSFNSN